MPAHELVLRVIDALSHQPLCGAEIVCRLGKRSSSTPLQVLPGPPTNDQGEAGIRVEEDLDHLVVGALLPGWAPRCVRWDPSRGDRVPESYTLRLKPIERAAGGVLRSPDGLPAADAEIRLFFLSGGDHSDREPQRETTGTSGFSATVVARSDAEGRWSTRLIPEDHPGFLLSAHHLDYAATPISMAGPSVAPTPDWAESTEATKRLWLGQVETVLERPLRVTGTVRDASGIPVPDAEVILSRNGIQKERRTRTNSQGKFSLDGLRGGSFEAMILSRGFAPSFPCFLVHPEALPVEVTLQRSEALRLRVVDASGSGIPGVLVVPAGLRGCEQVWEGRTDANGRVEWPDAPPDTPFPIYLRKPGWVEVRDREVLADGSEQTITLRTAALIRGRVVDAATSLPIAAFKVVPRSEYDRWDRGDTHHGHDGDFTLEVGRGMNSFRFRVEAKDYRPTVVGPLDPGQVATSPLEIRLTRADPALAIQGWVLLPDGSPAVNVEVGLLSAGTQRHIGRHNLGPEGDHLPDQQTDGAGAFRFPPEATGEAVVAVADFGIAESKVPEPGQPLTLRLQPWGRIEGKLEGRLRKNPAEMVYLVPRGDRVGSLLALANPTAVCDSNGRFVFHTVPPGTHALHLCIHEETGTRPCYRRPVTVPAGGTVDIRIAEAGPIVKGRLVVDASAGMQLSGDWKDFAVTWAAQDLPPPPRPLPGHPLPVEERERLLAETRRIQDLRSGILSAFPDSHGCFQSPEGLAPGDYVLGVHSVPELPIVAATAKSGRGRIQHPTIRHILRWARIKQSTPFLSIPFRVPASDKLPEHQDPIDLGDIRVHVPPP
jgi:hypothetical protein